MKIGSDREETRRSEDSLREQSGEDRGTRLPTDGEGRHVLVLDRVGMTTHGGITGSGQARVGVGTEGGRTTHHGWPVRVTFMIWATRLLVVVPAQLSQ